MLHCTNDWVRVREGSVLGSKVRTSSVRHTCNMNTSLRRPIRQGDTLGRGHKDNDILQSHHTESLKHKVGNREEKNLGTFDMKVRITSETDRRQPLCLLLHNSLHTIGLVLGTGSVMGS